jgi:AcrR family transcriptional regulator
MNLTSQRRRGRPAGETRGLREQILDAALLELSARPAQRPSLRQLARQARVTPALLNYHFMGMPGVYEALLEERAAPLLQPALEELRSLSPDATTVLTRFVQKWTALALRHAWLLPCLMQAEALQRGPLHDCGLRLRAAIRQAQQDGALRPDLPDDYVAMVLLMLGAMPHLAATSIGTGVGLRTDAAATAQLTLHHLGLLRAGVAARS